MENTIEVLNGKFFGKEKEVVEEPVEVEEEPGQEVEEVVEE